MFVRLNGDRMLNIQVIQLFFSTDTGHTTARIGFVRKSNISDTTPWVFVKQKEDEERMKAEEARRKRKEVVSSRLGMLFGH